MTVTADDLRNYLEIGSYVDNAVNTALERAVTAATTAVERYTGRTFTAPGDTGTARIFIGADPLYIDDFKDDPSLIEESADHTTWSTVSATWWSQPHNAATRYSLHGRCWAPFVRVTAKWGVDDDLIAEAVLPTLMKAARIYKRKDSVTGLEGFNEFGPVRITRASDPDVAELLDPLRRMDRAGIA